jgi:hypothetical protein
MGGGRLFRPFSSDLSGQQRTEEQVVRVLGSYLIGVGVGIGIGIEGDEMRFGHEGLTYPVP